MPERSPAFAAFVVLLAAAASAVAQTPCETGLQAAGKSYGLGQFAEVPGQLAPCLQGRISRTLQAQAYSLLARAWLAADEPAKARQAVSDLLRADPTFEPGPPPRFGQLVAEVRRAQATVEVTSVSKTKESLFEAPATVVVITGAEIERRGYLDLEQVLHDLPGLDASTTRDYDYSTIAVRGFVSGNTGRNLLLLDGVEQNDLSTNALYLSRQYPLSNIDRVEVVYGPASTMYGANAYTGVISVVTKEPEALVAEDKRVGVVVQAAAGGLHTRYGDMTLAGKDASGNVSWSLASRYYHDDDTELSRFPAYRYDYTSVDYQDTLRLTGPLAQLFTSIHPCGASPLYACRFDSQGRLSSIELTPAGESLARQLDRQFVQQNHFVVADPTDDWLVYGKLKIANLVLGAELWRTQEGTIGYGSLFQDGTSLWAPRQSLVYAKYVQPLGRELTFKAFLRYQQSGLDRSGTRAGFLSTYANGTLGLFNLVPPCATGPQQPLGCPGQPWDSHAFIGDLSSQFRGELSLIYEPSPKFSAVGGIEIWKSSIQSTLDEEASGPTGVFVPLTQPVQVEHSDLATYLQASYKLRDALKLVLAGRLNYNAIQNRPGASGYGLLFSPRAAVVYTPIAGRLVLKAIYSEAFKDPTDTEKFGTLTGINNAVSGGLETERVRNYEIGAGWHPSGRLSFDASAYQANYSGLVALRLVPGCMVESGCFDLQYHNLNSYRIRGLMLDARYRLGKTEINGNYTLTAPFQLDPRDLFGNPVLDAGGRPLHELRIADVPEHGASLGANRDLPAHFNADLRLRFVGALPPRLATNDSLPARDRIGSQVETQATVSYRGIMPGTTLQLTVDNLFDRTYIVPDREPLLGVPIPHPGRVIILRLITGLGRPARTSPDS